MRDETGSQSSRDAKGTPETLGEIHIEKLSAQPIKTIEIVREVDDPERFRIGWARCSTCPRFNYCPVHEEERKRILRNKEQEFPEVVEKLAQLAWRRGDKKIPKYIEDREYEKALRQKLNFECPLEKDIVATTLKELKKAYDLQDGRIYLVVRELLIHLLNNFRLDAEFGHNGLLVSMERNGREFMVPHLGTTSKIQFSKLFLEYLKELDNLTSNKVSFRIEGDITMRDVLEDIRKLDSPDNIEK